ncbi:VOC family protein [Streptomyces sp. SID8379]|uniref:VOC family protein n=1 Tax=unclassified Streptomyces TaxID=2593676 RepID=UPI00035C4FF6|nr:MULTISPECIES: VOC family protein [unclassified Streptomyces]MYW70084.1 VOC family protein [Streptomyces sp. SID8379]
MIKGLSKLEVITLFAEDLAATKAFYTDVFGLEVVYENEDSAVIKFDNLMLNVLTVANAPELVTPTAVAGADTGPRALFTLEVADANAVCAELERHGVALLNGPIDRPWGRRTAAFADPAGHVWEIAEVLHD